MLLVLVALAGQDPDPSDAVRDDASMEAPVVALDRRVELDLRADLTYEEIQGGLRALAAAYPELLRLESMGRSRDGQELWLATLTDLAEGDASARPSMLVLPELGQARHASELLLACVYEILQRAAFERELTELVGRANLLFAPLPDPDGRAVPLRGDDSLEPLGVDLGRNFPVRWDPWRGGGGAGPYPLSEPETRALAELIVGRPRLAALVVLVARGRPSPSLDLLGEADQAVYSALGAALGEGLRPAFGAEPGAPREGGGLLEFAQAQAGTYGLVAPWVAETLEGGTLVPVAERLVASLVEAGRCLARLEGRAPRVERLAPSLWQVDLTLTNLGLLPSGPGPGAGAASDRLAVEGAVPRAAALRAGGAATHHTVPTAGQGVALPPLRGGGALDLRLVLAAEPGTHVVLDLVTLRAGDLRLELDLRDP